MRRLLNNASLWQLQSIPKWHPSGVACARGEGHWPSLPVSCLKMLLVHTPSPPQRTPGRGSWASLYSTPSLKLVLNWQSAQHWEPGMDISGGRKKPQQLWKFLDSMVHLWTFKLKSLFKSYMAQLQPTYHSRRYAVGKCLLKKYKTPYWNSIPSFRDDCISLLYSFS